MNPRIAPIPFKKWPPELSEALPTINRAGEPGEERTQKAKNLLGTLAHHPPLQKVLLPFHAHVMRSTTLAERQRELLIMRVAVLRDASYTWAEHYPVALRAGLEAEEIARVAYGPSAPYWNSLDAALLRSADELVRDGVITDKTWAELAEQLEPRQLLDVIFTVGAYETLTWLIRSFNIELDEDLLQE
jgi:alkylhydroperoxidase family enzyme